MIRRIGIMDKDGRDPTTPEEKKQYRFRVFNAVRNIFALLTAICFITSFFLQEGQFLVRGIGYSLGVFAYFAELLELTEGFNTKKHIDDLFMAICFGGMYILLAVSYIMEHYGH